MGEVTLLQQQQNYIREKLRREFGPGVCDFLRDPQVIEIMVNGDGRVWVDRLDVGMADTGIVLASTQIECAIGTVAALQIGMVANHASPLIKAELPDGERFQGVMRPVAQPSFVIRKHLPQALTMAQMVESGTLTTIQSAVLEEAIRTRQNIVIGGATLSGKTVLADSLMYAMCEIFGPLLRLVLIEDTYELHCPSENAEHLHSSDTVSLRQLVQTTMRLRPDRIIVGEVRGAEALDLLKAWGTGHPGGVTTIHANSAKQAMIRLESLVEEAGVKPNPQMIAQTVNIVVMMERAGSREWKVREIVECAGWDGHDYEFASLKEVESEYKTTRPNGTLDRKN